MKLQKKIPFRKMLLLIGWKDHQEELNSDSKLKEVFFLTHPKSVQISPFHQVFGQFGAECCMFISSEWPCGAILHQNICSL